MVVDVQNEVFYRDHKTFEYFTGDFDHKIYGDFNHKIYGDFDHKIYGNFDHKTLWKIYRGLYGG